MLTISQVSHEYLQNNSFERRDGKIWLTMKRLGHTRSASGGGEIRYFGHRRYVDILVYLGIKLFNIIMLWVFVKVVHNLLPDFRRKSDFRPKKDNNDGSSGIADKYLGPMTHRRRKSEGYIDHDYNKVTNMLIYLEIFRSIH